jgi:hypothetical protein
MEVVYNDVTSASRRTTTVHVSPSPTGHVTLTHRV